MQMPYNIEPSYETIKLRVFQRAMKIAENLNLRCKHYLSNVAKYGNPEVDVSRVKKEMLVGVTNDQHIYECIDVLSTAEKLSKRMKVFLTSVRKDSKISKSQENKIRSELLKGWSDD